MSNIHEWSTAAASNNSAPPDGAPENMLAGKVNDCLREVMASLARWYQDNRGSSLVAAQGTANAYTLTSNQVYAALSDIALVTFRIPSANTGSVTLNIDSLGAKTWYKRSGNIAYASGDLVADQMVTVAYNSTNDSFETIGGQAGEFDSTDGIVMSTATAPGGWTQDATAGMDDVALRLRTSAPSQSVGGSTVFSSVLTSRTIAQANLPSYNLSYSLSWSASNSISQYQQYTNVTAIVYSAGGGQQCVSSFQHPTSSYTPTGTISGTIPSGGSGTAMDFAIKYREVMLVTKD